MLWQMSHRTREKTYVRSEAELELQREALRHMARTLEGASFNYYLSSGTLLGIVRDGDLIPWDWDLGLYFKTEEIWGRLPELCQLLVDAGFVVERCEMFYKSSREVKVVARFDGIKFELLSWSMNGAFRMRRSRRIPAHIFEGNSSVVFFDHSFTTFLHPTDYLEWAYGDWKIPLRTADKSVYLSDNYSADASATGLLSRARLRASRRWAKSRRSRKR